MRFALGAILVAAAAFAYFWSTHPDDPIVQNGPEYASETAIVAIALPEALSDAAERGEVIFNENCSVCHGTDAVGQVEVAPPLVHVIYEPSHHGDEAFQRAVSQGVRGHHGPFGDMPPVEGLSREDVELIIAYVREIQSANGIN